MSNQRHIDKLTVDLAHGRHLLQLALNELVALTRRDPSPPPAGSRRDTLPLTCKKHVEDIRDIKRQLRDAGATVADLPGDNPSLP